MFMEDSKIESFENMSHVICVTNDCGEKSNSTRLTLKRLTAVPQASAVFHVGDPWLAAANTGFLIS